MLETSSDTSNDTLQVIKLNTEMSYSIDQLKTISRLSPCKQALETVMESCSKLQWSNGRRSYSEPFGPLVDSGRSSLTSYGSQESLLSEDSNVFSDCYTDSEDEEDFEDLSLSRYQYVWDEWTIPASDILLHDQIVGNQPDEIVKSGYWHGSVWIYQSSLDNSDDLHSFVSEVKALCRIRHENIQLFMGVCVDLPDKQVGIVMSDLKGIQLHTHLHTLGHNFTTQSKFRILRQIAEGMEYLHAKGIPHGALSSKMITLHHRVCISLSLSKRSYRKLDSTDLVYLPHEEIRSVCYQSTRQMILKTQPSFASDVFAFGTLTYELVSLELPFKDVPLIDIIWCVGNGHHQPLTLLSKGRFRSVITRCWNQHSIRRPTFKEVLTSIQDDVILPLSYNSTCSYSVPSQLCTLGK